MESIKNKCDNKLIEESSLEFPCTTTKLSCNELVQIISSLLYSIFQMKFLQILITDKEKIYY